MLLPVVLVIAVPFVSFISSLVVSRGWVKFLPFISIASGIVTLMGVVLAVPSAFVMAYIGMVSVVESFYFVVYSSIAMFLSAIAPAALWWLLGDKTHIVFKPYAP